MKLIGTKKKNLMWAYVLGMVLGCIIILCGIMANIKEGAPLILVFIGVIVFIICLIYFIDVLKSPNEVIYYNQDNKYILINDKKEIIYLRNIKNLLPFPPMTYIFPVLRKTDKCYRCFL